MELRLRLVPVAIAATIGLLGVKLGDVWITIAAPPALAQTATPAAKPAAPPPSAAGTPSPAAKAAPGPAAKGGPAPSAPAAHTAEKAIDPLSISPAEVELLQKLSDRRAALDKRAADLSQREVLLQATEKRIDEKIAKLQTLEKDIGGIVDKQSQEDDARLKSLVKIYQTMKPVDAARIFEQLDMPVLLGVVENMKERSAAPILAAMDPAKARALTLALAERRGQRDAAAIAQQNASAQTAPAAKK